MKKLKYYEVKEFDTIKEMMEIAVNEAGEEIAFKYKEDGKIIDRTYREFQNDTIHLGTALTTINMQDKHIAVIGENSYKWLTVYLSALKTNGVFVPVDKELPKEDIINVLKHSDSEILFFSKKFQKYIEDIKIEIPNMKYFVGFDLEEDTDGIISYDRFIKKGEEAFINGNKDYVSIQGDSNALRMLVYTSGTTGLSKGVMLSEHNLVSDVYYGLQVSTVYDRCLSVLPYHHTYEAVAGILVALHHHSTICINDNLKSVLKNLQLFKPDYIYLVPAFAEVFYKKIWATVKEQKKETGLKILIKVSNFLRFFKIDLRKKLFKTIHDSFGGNLVKIVVGGAPLRPELGKFFDSIGISLVNGYGITECSPLVSANMDNFNDCQTVGIPLRCCEIKLENVTPEGDGEICVKGYMVMLGYYKNEELTREVLKEGWFNTGDYGKINAKGQLMITGRKKNLIVLENGKNIFPEELEGYIMSIPYVLEVVVKATKNEHGIDKSLYAEVFLNDEKVKELKIDNIEEQIKKDIIEVTSDLPVYKRIHEVKVRDVEFPKTTTNKIKR